MGAVTVITSGKGGVGKSTVSVGLARALARKGRRVLLIDCDAGLRCLDRMTGIGETLLYDSADVAGGRCAPADAIYPCEKFPGIFVMPAPARGDDLVEAPLMKRLVQSLRGFYDHVLLDCPAGVGRGFQAACVPADRALVVCNPEPVSVRSASSVKLLLEEMGVTKQRLVINRFNGNSFRRLRTLRDLDSVIDESGIGLLGVVPEDLALVAAFLRGEETPRGCKSMLALSRIAGRLEGERIPIHL